ncbi:CorA family divalent cation transporter [Cellulomonas shaoxiangyii]|uniref:Magnesium and cobalt transport protein CorA n=1 Tax=Cellulomonas shaoxiangyii TaxID=2566013 RepID=A0A4P7SGY9_9CELL|nr:CorA family divalent cation transporter [Cellulomonas shaoxiangyii]QCB93449.1 magnesium and cobalt transport protein CorA [Cellulomonas shaoxiangyii]TGY84566.1 magnesium and cobalt transport protein CorA [Cellulomonas shaoxiangyii]
MTTQRPTAGPTARGTVPSDEVRARVWAQDPVGWRPWNPADGGASTVQGALAQVDGPVWAVVDDRHALLAAGRLVGVGRHTAESLARHLAADGARRARVDQGTGDEVVFTVPTVSFVEHTRDVRTGWITAVLGGRVVVMLEEGDAGVLAAAAHRLVDDEQRAAHAGHPVLAATLLALVDAASEVESSVADAVAYTERAVFSDAPEDEIAGQVYDLKREIAEARRAVTPLATALPDLVDRLVDAEPGHRRPRWLERLESTVERIDQHLDQDDGLLSDMLDVHLAQVSVQQNEDMRRISAWAAIIAVPTFIAGVFGMNFEHMTGLGWRYGYPVALAAMAASAVVLWLQFRRSGWWGVRRSPARTRARGRRSAGAARSPARDRSGSTRTGGS